MASNHASSNSSDISLATQGQEIILNKSSTASLYQSTTSAAENSTLPRHDLTLEGQFKIFFLFK